MNILPYKSMNTFVNQVIVKGLFFHRICTGSTRNIIWRLLAYTGYFACSYSTRTRNLC